MVANEDCRFEEAWQLLADALGGVWRRLSIPAIRKTCHNFAKWRTKPLLGVSSIACRVYQSLSPGEISLCTTRAVCPPWNNP